MIAAIAEIKKMFSDRMKIIFIFMIAMIASIAELFFSAIAAIVASIWKPGFNVLLSGCSWINDSDPDHPKGTHPQHTS